ncbi:MAG: OmpA family protein [Myxococcaceae bacterium]
MNPRHLAVALLLLAGSAAAAKPDRKGCTDHPIVPTRMPEYWIDSCATKEFDSYEFLAPRGQKQRVEGKFTRIIYRCDGHQTEQSGVAVARNYENAIKKAGGVILNMDPDRWVNGKIVKDGRETWVQAEKGGGSITVRIIEKEAMQQHIVADADAFSKDLQSTGHTSVEGIYFDTGKAVVKPESTPALEQVAKLLKADATLKLWVVGHTDSVGGAEANMKLAQARGEAVVTVLSTAHGIAAARLKGYGVGPLAPVASNESEEGRAKNRRVELVKQ